MGTRSKPARPVRRGETKRGNPGIPAGERTGVSLSGMIMVLCLLSTLISPPRVQGDDTWTGPRVMDEVFKRHERVPCVYEEQTVILKDAAGNRNVRKARRFSRVEEDGSRRVLLVFETPPEIHGVALLGIGQPSGRPEWRIYLPALGKRLISSGGDCGGGSFLGTDFSVADLTAEVLSDFRYARVADHKIDLVPCYVIEAFPRDEEVARFTGTSLRRHFIRKDNLFIVRTDYYDRRKRFFKRQTFHDVKRVDGDVWRADMILMENTREKHETLIKVDRRVFSCDNVPSEMFTPAWLLENRHIRSPERRLFQEDARTSPPQGEVRRER
jgi:hypothetical protein